MIDYDALRQKILQNAGAPKRVKSDNTEVEQFDMNDQLALLEKLEKEEAKAGHKKRFAIIKMNAGGAP